MSEKPKTRQMEIAIEIAVPVETVWKAITDADEIIRWFAPEAKVVPGVGGSIWFSWGPGMEGTSPIEIWEPNQHLRTASVREKTDEQSEPVRIVVDYILAPVANGTVLRLIQSGFGASAEWDSEFDATQKGWGLFFTVLKFGLEQHPGEAARQLTLTVPSPYSQKETWEHLMGPEGLRAPAFVVGEPFALTTADGDKLHGRVSRLEAPGTLGLVIENWNQALMAVFNEHCQGRIFVTLMVVVYGEALAQADERLAKLKGLLQRTLPEAKPVGAA